MRYYLNNLWNHYSWWPKFKSQIWYSATISPCIDSESERAIKLISAEELTYLWLFPASISVWWWLLATIFLWMLSTPRVQVLLLWEHLSKAALLLDIVWNYLSAGVFVQKLDMGAHHVARRCHVPAPSSQLHFVRQASRRPDAYRIGTLVICLPSACGSRLISASWMFHEDNSQCTYPTPIITHTSSHPLHSTPQPSHPLLLDLSSCLNPHQWAWMFLISHNVFLFVEHTPASAFTWEPNLTAVCTKSLKIWVRSSGGQQRP